MSERADFQPIRAVIEGCWPGEWGTDPVGDQSNCTVYRATDIDDEGHLSLEAGAARVVAPMKLAVKSLRKGDLLLEAAGGAPDRPVGRVALVATQPSKPSLTSNFFRYLRPKPCIDPTFLVFQLVALNRSSAIWRYQQQTTGLINLKVHDYLSHPVWTPPLPTQEKIATILSTIDTAIEQTEALIEKYQHIKAGLMHDLFTRGVLPNGQLRPPREQAPELYQETAIGWIPREWRAKSLSEYCGSDITYGIVQAGPHVDGGVPYIRTGDMSDDHLKLDKLLRTTPTIASSYKRSEVRAGEIVMAIRATVGKVLPVPPELDGANLTQGTAKISAQPSVEPRFLLWAIRDERFQRRLMAEIKGTTFAEITLKDLRLLPLAMPTDKREQRQIATQMEACEKRIKTSLNFRNKLKQQKLGLMQDLLTGKVPVTVDSADNAAHA